MAGQVESSAASANRWRVLRWAAAAALIALPWIAMQFSDEMDWSAFDFAIFGALVVITGLGYGFLASRGRTLAYRAGVALALATAFFLVWSNLAVGIIGDEDNPANLMYLGVLAVAGIGAAFAGLRADGMYRAMLATAGAQTFVGMIAVAFGLGATGPIWPLDVIGVTGFVDVLWLGSALLFRRAAEEQPLAPA